MDGYKVKRGEVEYSAASLAELRQWALSGRVAPSDYVFNPTLGRWTYAREMQELRESFPAGKNANTVIVVGAVLVLAGAVIPRAGLFVLLGIVLLVVGVARRKS